jgi:uncharacterized membrane protein HdeD (DUF308 family)
LRWLALAAGAALTVLAFAAATRVVDTREGLIAEIVTLLAGLAGISLLTYAFVARNRPLGVQPSPARAPEARRPRATRDLLLGVAGIAVGLVLLAGLAISGGALWAGFGLAILLPMLAGSVYLCVRYLRASP